MGGVAARVGLGDALQGQIGQRQPHLGGIVVAEGGGEVAELGEALGKDGAGIRSGGTAVCKGGEHDHGVALIGHDEVKPVEREVRCDQRTVNLDAPQDMAVRRQHTYSGKLRRHALAAMTRHLADGRPGQRLSKAPACTDYTRTGASCNTRVESSPDVSQPPGRPGGTEAGRLRQTSPLTP